MRAHARLDTAPLVGAPTPAAGRIQEDPGALFVATCSEPDPVGTGQVVDGLAGEPGQGLPRRRGAARGHGPAGAAELERPVVQQRRVDHQDVAPRGSLLGSGGPGQAVQSLAEALGASDVVLGDLFGRSQAPLGQPGT